MATKEGLDEELGQDLVKSRRVATECAAAEPPSFVLAVNEGVGVAPVALLVDELGEDGVVDDEPHLLLELLAGRDDGAEGAHVGHDGEQAV